MCNLTSIRRTLSTWKAAVPLLGILSLLVCGSLGADGETELAVPPLKELEEIVSRTEQLAFTLTPTEEVVIPGISPRYLISVTGASDTLYDFFIYNIAYPNDGLPGTAKGVIDTDGYLCTGPKHPSEQGLVIFAMATTNPGETFLCYLVAHDRTAAAAQFITPNPKFAERDGYRISMQLADPHAEAFLLLIEGCEPNEPLTFASVSCTEFLSPHHTQADSNGRCAVTYSPAVVGEVGGTFSHRVRGSRGGVILVSPWGEQYWNQNQEYQPTEVSDVPSTTTNGGLSSAGESTAQASYTFSLLTKESRLRVGHFLGSILAPEATLTRLFVPEKIGTVLAFHFKPHKAPQALAAFICVAYPFKAQLKKMDRWVI